MSLVKKSRDPSVERGDQFTLPHGMDLKSAIHCLMRKMKEEEELVSIHETVDAYPLDGAYAFMHVLREMFGWAQAVPTPGFFGPKPPALVDLEVDYNVKAQVIWGSFMVPSMEDAKLETSGKLDENGRPTFVISGTTKQKYRAVVREIAENVRERVKRYSVYKAKAIRISTDDEGNLDFKKPPRFLDLSGVNPDELTFSREVAQQVETTLWTPIRKTEMCRRMRIPLKRGVLLEGPYGTGKTLTAYVTAAECLKNGWTFIYLDRVGGLQAAIRLAALYGPAVIFAEDIDRVVYGERSVKIDDILNQIDGIEAKSQECIVILTTNHVERIERAMLRPGRLDSVISVTPPDAAAAERLVRIYGRKLIAAKTDLSAIGRALAGQIPAVIREVVERAKLFAISRLGEDAKTITLEASDLSGATYEMKRHLELMKGPPCAAVTPEEAAGSALGSLVKKELTTHINGQITSRLDKLLERGAHA